MLRLENKRDKIGKDKVKGVMRFMTKKLKDKLWHRRAAKTADKVIDYAKKFDDLSDDEIKLELSAQKSTLKVFSDENLTGEILARMLPEVFGLVYVASKRTLGLEPYKVQIIGGIALHEGNIAEAKTGEGKTLMAAMPAVLHALLGRGVHIVTVNPYLTKRDAENIGRIYQFLGLSVGYVIPGMSNIQRKEAYACDITYVSNTELGFDYLRDNMVIDANQAVQRGLSYAIIDEVDSILIDEAKTPLIIAGQGKDVSLLYNRVNKVVASLTKGSESKAFNKSDAYVGEVREELGDYIVHEKDHNVVLTAAGVKRIEEGLGLTNYADSQNYNIQRAVEQSLQAHGLMHRGKDYIVRDDKILIVDEFTGRVMDGRHYSDGLHQAIEAKEHVTISVANETIGTTTYQNFFRKYDLLSGMTGTAYTERDEFMSTYHLDVKVIPTNEPMIREDLPDKLYVKKWMKYREVSALAQESAEKGRPVLIGTSSVEESEKVSAHLYELGVDHQVLNAKQDAHEAEVISKAGISGTVTVATNMAGRGTDIILDEDALKAGGLLVIGTEKHESERIDNQLRGRAGRQGDPGTSVFYCSLEDRVMRLYGADSLAKNLNQAVKDEMYELKSPIFMKAIKTTQRKVEANNAAARRNTLEYDDVNDMQRERIYQERHMILAKQDVTSHIKEAIVRAVERAYTVLPCDEVCSFLESQTGLSLDINMDKKLSIQYIINAMKDINFQGYDKEGYARRCMLIAIDSAWAEHLKALEFCKDAVGYAGFGQVDPKALYAHEAYDLYEKMQNNIYAAAMFVYFSERPDRKNELDSEDGTSLKLKSGKGMVV